MVTLMWVIVVLLILLLIILIALWFRIPAFKKEAKEFYIVVKEGISDRKLTEEEKTRIRKEWVDIDWRAAIVELFKGLKSK